jgi:predicted enzyme related to lactoylglutathione lyase
MSQIDRRLVLTGLGGAALPGAAQAQTGANVRHHGILIRAPNLDAALAFYCDGLGFLLGDFQPRTGWARLSSNLPLYLDVSASGCLHGPEIANAEITFQSADLEASIPFLRASGARITTETPYEVAVGRSIRFADTFGVIHHMLQASRVPPAFTEPRIYNCGLDLPVAAIAPTRALLEQGFGFIAATERYYPPSIPYLEADRSFGFMLHHHQPGEPDLAPRSDARRDDLGCWQIYIAADLRAAADAARAYGAIALDRAPRRFPMGRRMAFTTPGGGPFEIWSWT